MIGPKSERVESGMSGTSAATHALLRRIEWRQWGLWSSAVLVTLLLTLAIGSFALPEFAPQLELFDRLYLQQGVRGLLGLVLLFDVYTVYQQIQINRIRRQLARHDELFRLISENAADMIALVDVNGRRLYNSPAYQKVLGYAPGELQTTSAFEQIHPDDRQRVIEAAEEARRTALGRRVDYRMRHKDGTWRVLESTASAIRNASGEIEKLVIVNRDITERTQAGEALRRSEANFRSLVENAPYGICRASADGTLLLVNPALVDILGYGSPADLLGANLFAGVFRDPGAQKSLMEQSQSRGKFKDVEVEWKRKDGSPITVRCSARPVKDSGGGVAYFEVTAEDVTERRLLERRFRQMQKMEAVGQLTGGIAHDFNNLLGVIIGYSEILQQRMAQADGLRTFVDEIKKAGMRAASLTRQLLAFSRQQVLEPKVLDLNAVVSDIEKMLRRLIGEDVEFNTRLERALGAVKADQSQLEQVLVNLAVNARDAMPRGGKLILATANVELDEAYARHHPGSRPGRYVMLSMTDTGTGMSPETQAHIFEPFFTTKERGKGTGLGLATVYGVIKQSDGYIWVDSELGKGTTFTIYLPRVEEPVSHTGSTQPKSEARTGSETILVVEDAESLRKLTHELLKNEGYTVLSAATGAEALQISEGHAGPLHLLLTDVVMPGMNGRELAEQITARRPELRVMYMSGYTDSVIDEHGVLEPGTYLLHKPFTQDTLARKVREVLDGPKPTLPQPAADSRLARQPTRAEST